LKKFALIVAGGSGSRMGSDVPKQFMPLAGKPVLLHTLGAFKAAYDDMLFILVLPESFLKQGEAILADAGFDLSLIKVVAGGRTRFHSVQNGLKWVDNDAIVFVHDAVRCLVTPNLIKSCYAFSVQYGSAVPAIPVRDSIREMTLDGVSVAVDREKLRIIQTPQTFHSTTLKSTFSQEYREEFTDEASVLEFHGIRVHLIEGEQTNIKLTFREDLEFAEWKLGKR
jgi:2-C-methyl-D-erythritol 4-phosphate cytidylyltransferase